MYELDEYLLMSIQINHIYGLPSLYILSKKKNGLAYIMDIRMKTFKMILL